MSNNTKIFLTIVLIWIVSIYYQRKFDLEVKKSSEEDYPNGEILMGGGLYTPPKDIFHLPLFPE